MTRLATIASPLTPAIRGAILAILLSAAGCGSSPQTDSASPANPSPRDVARTRPGETTTFQQIRYARGSRLVVPLDEADLAALDRAQPPSQPETDAPPSLISLRLADGRPLVHALHRVGPIPESGFGAGEVAPDAWLGPGSAWGASQIAGPSGPLVGGSLVAVALMPDDAPEQDLWINLRRVRVAWAPAVEGLPAAEPAQRGIHGEDPWAPALPTDLRTDPTLRVRLDRIARDPTRRWRVRLALDGLAPDAPSTPFAEPALEAIAEQLEAQWRLALGRLWLASPGTAARLRAALTRTANLGQPVPVWTEEPEALDSLLADLLAPGATPARLAELAEVWMIEQPGFVAWVADDAIALADDATLAQIALANLSDRATLAWVATPQGERLTDPTPLEPRSVARLSVRLAPDLATNPDQPAEGIALRAHAGAWSAPVRVLPPRWAIRPPGLAVGPLLADQDLPRWVAGVAQPPEPAWQTAALLHRKDEPNVGPGWRLFVEARLTPGQGLLEREHVTIHLGPSIAPTHALRVGIDGQVRDLLRPSDILDRVAVSRGRDRWSFSITLPDLGEPDFGTPDVGERGLPAVRLLAITRTDALGRRSSWPRPMLPWEREPGRAAVDPSAWD